MSFGYLCYDTIDPTNRFFSSFDASVHAGGAIVCRPATREELIMAIIGGGSALVQVQDWIRELP